MKTSTHEIKRFDARFLELLAEVSGSDIESIRRDIKLLYEVALTEEEKELVKFDERKKIEKKIKELKESN